MRRKLQLKMAEEEREVEGLMSDEWQWVGRCSLKGGRGGVGLAVSKTTVLEEMSREGML